MRMGRDWGRARPASALRGRLSVVRKTKSETFALPNPAKNDKEVYEIGVPY